MQQFLQKRRAGIAAPRLIAEKLGIEMPLLFTLLQVDIMQGSFGGRALTQAEMRSHTRHLYGTRDHLSAPIATLMEKGLMRKDEEGRFSLTPQAQEAVASVHEAGRAHVAQLQPLPPDILEELLRQLERGVDAVMRDPVLAPRPGSQLAGSRSLATFGPDAPVMVRIEQSIYDLWHARDDAHIKAWREAGMEGPPMSTLTVLWLGETDTVRGLAEKLQDNYAPEDMEGILAYLFDKDYIMRDGDEIKLTPAGALAREDIERETDRIYFASWPHTQEEAEWMRDKLGELIDNIPVVDSR